MTIMNPRELHSRKPFQGLFPIREDTLNAVVEHMRVHGFDPSYPIVYTCIDDEITVVDGHTRLRAARMLNLDAVPVTLKTFSSEEEALQYAIHNQRDRRNITDGDLLPCIEAVDKLKKRGGDHKSEKSKASIDAIDKGKSSEETVRIVGISPRKVERARAILSKGDSDTKQEILHGKKSINKAYQETKTREESVTVHQDKEAPTGTESCPSAEPQSEKIETKAITDESLIRLLSSTYERIAELKRQNWQGCPKETVTERLRMLLRLVEE